VYKKAPRKKLLKTINEDLHWEPARKIRKDTINHIVDVFERIWKYSVRNRISEVEWSNQLEKLRDFLKKKGYMWKYNSLKDYMILFMNKYWLKKTVEAINALLEKNGISLKINKWRLSELKNWKYDL